jgi:hypothetical protein
MVLEIGFLLKQARVKDAGVPAPFARGGDAFQPSRLSSLFADQLEGEGNPEVVTLLRLFPGVINNLLFAVDIPSTADEEPIWPARIALGIG